MATIYTHKSENIRKTWFLMIIFFALIGVIGYVLAQQYHNPTLFIGALVFSLLMNVGSFWFSDKIVIATSGAVLADETRFLELHRLVENLAIIAGLPKPKIYIINDQAPNAFATGRDPKHAAVAVTTGLLSILDKQELEGVIAHELSHIGNRDMLLMTVATVLVGFVGLVAHWLSRSFLFRGRDNEEGGGIVGLLVVFALTLVAQLFATLLQLAISRKREYLADASGALLTRYPEGLVRALEKISSYDGEVMRANSATAHLYISNPFGSIKEKSSHLFSTHPPISERVKRLKQMGNISL